MGKICDLEQLLLIRAELKRQGKIVVFTNGCFDLLHGGHIHLFNMAKKQGDVLVVAVNDDASIREFKGVSRPIFALAERLEILEALEAIDYLAPFSQSTPQRLIEKLLPDVLVKGGDWAPNEVVGKPEVEADGGRVQIVPYLNGHSSTRILTKISSLFSQKKTR